MLGEPIIIFLAVRQDARREDGEWTKKKMARSSASLAWAVLRRQRPITIFEIVSSG